jgi:hypothetical protein
MHELQAGRPGCAFTPTSLSAAKSNSQQSSPSFSATQSRVSSLPIAPLSEPAKRLGNTEAHSTTTTHSIPSHPITIYLYHCHVRPHRSSLIATHPASPLSPSAHMVAQRAAGVGDHDGRAPRQGTAGSEPSERALRPTESVVQDLACGAAIAAVRHWCS